MAWRTSTFLAMSTKQLQLALWLHPHQCMRISHSYYCIQGQSEMREFSFLTKRYFLIFRLTQESPDIARDKDISQTKHDAAGVCCGRVFGGFLQRCTKTRYPFVPCRSSIRVDHAPSLRLFINWLRHFLVTASPCSTRSKLVKPIGSRFSTYPQQLVERAIPKCFRKTLSQSFSCSAKTITRTLARPPKPTWMLLTWHCHSISGNT